MSKAKRVVDSGSNVARDRARFALTGFGDSLAVQSEKDEADINTLVRRFGVGPLAAQQIRRPTYGDFTGVDNYQDAMNALNDARDSFMAMDSEVRHRFHNDPAEFVDFCSDDANLDEMRKMGLAVPEVQPETTLADVVSAVERSREVRYGDDGPLGSDARAAPRAPAGSDQGNGNAARGSSGARPGQPSSGSGRGGSESGPR